jgi:hypothetical protein
MRFSLVISVGLALCGVSTLAGCPLSRSDELSDPSAGGDDDNGVGSGAPQSFCTSDSDCELSSSSCCDCPSFATRRGAPTNNACTGVACPNPPVCPANVRAACNLEEFQCEVACVEIACATECPDGYAIDPATGCLSCQCAAPAIGGCTLDSDCVQTREDCCGCARGGKDTAVPIGSRGAYDQMLSCPPSPQCPGLDTCDADSAPRCVQGSCLLTDAPYPANGCTGACPSGTCVLNRDSDATTHGVGVCAPL